MLGIEQCAGFCDITVRLGSSYMRHIPEGEPVSAMKALLHDLENTRLIFPDDISILSLRRDLRARIAEFEKAQRTECAQAMGADLARSL